MAQATADYNLERETVAVREDAISFTVSIERREESKAIETVTWSAVH